MGLKGRVCCERQEPSSLAISAKYENSVTNCTTSHPTALFRDDQSDNTSLRDNISLITPGAGFPFGNSTMWPFKFVNGQRTVAYAVMTMRWCMTNRDWYVSLAWKPVSSPMKDDYQKDSREIVWIERSENLSFRYDPRLWSTLVKGLQTCSLISFEEPTTCYLSVQYRAKDSVSKFPDIFQREYKLNVWSIVWSRNYDLTRRSRVWN